MTESGSRVSCGLSLFFGLLPVRPKRTAQKGVTLLLGTKDLTRVPRIQVCCPTNVHDILTLVSTIRREPD
jgi:hypothetical protein